MNENDIIEHIEAIRNLFGSNKLEQAIKELRTFIASIDGAKESQEEQDWLTRVLTHESKYNELKAKKEIGAMTDEENAEFNNIPFSLLKIVGEVRNFGVENPQRFHLKTTKEKTITANYPVEKDQHVYVDPATLSADAPTPSKEENKGCLALMTNQEASESMNNWSKVLLRGVTSMLLLVGFGFFIFRMAFYSEGNRTTDSKTKPPVVTEQPPPKPLGKNCKELNLVDKAMCALANHMSNPETQIPKEFSLDASSFKKNSTKIPASVKKQLDELVVLLKEYENANIDIEGFYTKDENGKPEKETGKGLDYYRAQKVREYLINRGISENRITAAEGHDINDTNSPIIRILNR